MNAASVLVICIVAGLLVCAIVRSGKGRADKCGGDCTECAFRCDRNQY